MKKANLPILMRDHRTISSYLYAYMFENFFLYFLHRRRRRRRRFELSFQLSSFVRFSVSMRACSTCSSCVFSFFFAFFSSVFLVLLFLVKVLNDAGNELEKKNKILSAVVSFLHLFISFIIYIRFSFSLSA